ncbi:uncharacterized protein BJ171DRAFT_239670 [Polychytrium aggregatum]|uniref:uncharacterized protein n=1 Tax=Polychytrium aggregatum TaxID=110093 RepID=UPI0022FDF909|nr:uncharacterized protein BJ171DRAFT_239670 [Polychytrium aggregatum]KAI9208410.1 hypothetical protein BJ171DRAFT_239670 [Polychytrium aggregatum]
MLRWREAAVHFVLLDRRDEPGLADLEVPDLVLARIDVLAIPHYPVADGPDRFACRDVAVVVGTGCLEPRQSVGGIKSKSHRMLERSAGLRESRRLFGRPHRRPVDDLGNLAQDRCCRADRCDDDRERWNREHSGSGKPVVVAVDRQRRVIMHDGIVRRRPNPDGHAPIHGLGVVVSVGIGCPREVVAEGGALGWVVAGVEDRLKDALTDQWQHSVAVGGLAEGQLGRPGKARRRCRIGHRERPRGTRCCHQSTARYCRPLVQHKAVLDDSDSDLDKHNALLLEGRVDDGLGNVVKDTSCRERDAHLEHESAAVGREDRADDVGGAVGVDRGLRLSVVALGLDDVDRSLAFDRERVHRIVHWLAGPGADDAVRQR